MSWSSKQAALAFVAAAAPLILVSFWLAGGVGELLFGLLAAAFPVALIFVGASRKGRVGPLLFPLLLLLVVLEASVLAMLALRGRVLEGLWLAGLPLAAAVQLYAMWLGPLVLVSLVYALTFDSFNLTEKDLDRIRRAGETPRPPGGEE